MNEPTTELFFGQSIFKGENKAQIHILRFYTQLVCLTKKNCLILSRRLALLLTLLFVPCAMILVFMLGNRFASSSSTVKESSQYKSNNPIALRGLGPCNSYYQSQCIQIAYSPGTSPLRSMFDQTMQNVASSNNLVFGSDVLRFSSHAQLKSFVGNNIGKIQFSILFQNDSIWSFTQSKSNTVQTVSYVIFYNTTRKDYDLRSEQYQINFPLVTLQKTLEQSLLQVLNNRHSITYDLQYNEIWSFSSPAQFNSSRFSNTNQTGCNPLSRNFDDLSSAVSWVFSFGLQIIGIVAFQLVTEERSNGLLSSLRRIGLIESTYWMSWFLPFQVIIIIGSVLSLVLSACIQTVAYPLQKISYAVLFLLMWFGGTASVCQSFFLASLCSGPSMSTITMFVNFIAVVLTLASCSTQLNLITPVVTPVLSANGLGQAVTSCVRVTSSYNAIFSTSLTGNTFVQFLVFFLPWFHISQAITDILSIVQYDQKSFSFGDIYSLQGDLAYDASGGSMFTPPWVIWSFGMLLASSLVYLALAWFFSQAVSDGRNEGRNLFTILVPHLLKPLLQVLSGVDRSTLGEGDVRGQERILSSAEGSIRAYKLSKVFKGVQALKEVSFNLAKGQLFVLLGHNGAGKSTLINILTGNCLPTHGKVFLAGMDVDEDIIDIQQSIGVCPQEDFIWDDLTAREHMMVFAAFKGIPSGPLLDSAVEDMLHRVQLLSRADTTARHFSGGMKRRLSVAMSTVGEVKVLFLDEPTTGLDPLSRRNMWEMINKLKRDRVVILTTHSMEEADFLGDTVMILHGGRVKAWGDPLFLKSTYGTGYQLTIVVDKARAEATVGVVRMYLPQSKFVGDVSSGYISVTVAKNDTHFLTFFFHWLETSPDAADIKEWGFSNTTLEQVFLILCVQSTEVNYVDRAALAERALCPICHKNPRETLIMRNLDNKYMLLPDSVCQSCTVESDYLLSDDDMEPLLQTLESKTKQEKQGVINKLLGTVFMKGMKPLPVTSSSPDVHVDGSVPNPIQDVESQFTVPNNGSINIVTTRPSVQIVSLRGSFYAQVTAVMLKNVTLQKHQYCSNIFISIFVVIMILIFFVFGLLFNAVNSYDQCAQGYVSNQGCSTGVVANFIFNNPNGEYFSDRSDGVSQDLDDSFLISDYLTPVPQSLNAYLGVSFKHRAYSVSSVGLPSYGVRLPAIWSSYMNTTSAIRGTGGGYPFNLYPLPSAGRSDPNAYMFTNQYKTYKETLKSGCNQYAEAFAINTTDPYVTESVMATRFADVIYQCDTCQQYARANKTQLYFSGNIWVADATGGASKYSYAFINVRPSSTGSSLSGGKCPNNVDVITEAPIYPVFSKTITTMQYINILTNSMNDPTFQSYQIQGGVSSYGNMFFIWSAVAQFVSFFICIPTVLVMNGLWPLTVWRLAYERANNIQFMMKAVGMRTTAYILGMYIFDVFMSFFVSFFIMLVAVEANLSTFKGAPLGYLFTLCLLSAHALAGCAQLIVRISPKNSRLTALVAGCVSVAASIAALIIIIALYNDEGSWPNGLSIIPFFAQARVIYLLLSYHRTSPEVDTALGLLFLVGTISMIISFFLDSDVNVSHLLKNLFTRVHLRSIRSQSIGEHNRLPDIDVDTEPGDDDVISEREHALRYTPVVASGSRTAHIDATTFAVVLRRIHHEFETSGGQSRVAINELSLALKFGEVFGLLGPNGAGKSTTIGIICGALTATRGEAFVAGLDLTEDIGEVHKLVGLCPQEDFGWADLTVEEHLDFQARQRGVLSWKIPGEVQRVAMLVGLDGDAFWSRAGQLSGGMRRRLSIGMSIVADPPIVILDEPTAGLDPDNRQHIWRVIQGLKRPNRLVLLSTHSMEEAETLCSRVCILAKGTLQCIGSTTHLKAKFGRGYTLTVNMLPMATAVGLTSSVAEVDATADEASTFRAVDDFVRERIGGGEMTLLGAINHTRRYSVPKTVLVSDIFTEMELYKETLHIREWGLSMTTLEEVFISKVREDTVTDS